MWQIAIPAVLANLSTPLLGLTDSFIMGHMPHERYLAAVALGAMAFSILYNGVNFLRMGTTGLSAQSYGRSDELALNQLFIRGCISAAVIGFIFILLQALLINTFIMFMEAEENVTALTHLYFTIRIWGAPFALMNYVASGWLLGIGRAKEVLYIHLYMNVSNILLNFLFVYGFDMTADGVALGTVLSESTAFIICLYYVKRENRLNAKLPLFGADVLQDIMNMAAFKKLFSLNRDIFIRTMCLTLTLASFTLLGTRFGTEILAANAILMNIQNLTAYGLDGFAQAAEVLVGKEIGRKSKERLRAAVIISGKWAIFTASAFSIIYFLFGEMMINALTNIEAIRTIAHDYLIWIIVLPILSIWSFQLDGIFIGATAGSDMRNGMIISTGFYVICVYTLIPMWENHGLWAAYTVFIVLRALTLLVKYPAIEKRAI
ncbi:MATE family efflux transporter [Pseudemcibacter aquimaris]|uniref:MATE family efflux transporter n=1 Tax=Pseudemcibacter aquimaris TaxID=2857064 RepID=UPI002010FB9B|nr:MATE family efflux transporter [Pseudemcibacter aquimaris]MCC3860085.1 MATE family efflux transporter [Pseudemcibacter aquimaris]WDU57414.1 MATE family efflux transporter [Pseudemcibacter aquimaris]